MGRRALVSAALCFAAVSAVLVGNMRRLEAATDEAASYFPMIAGASWTYDGSVGGRKVAELKSTLGPVTVSSGRAIADMRNVTTGLGATPAVAPMAQTVAYSRSDAEVTCTYPSQPPDVLLQLPLKADASWRFKGGLATAEPATVATPLRTFTEAVKVTGKTSAGSTETWWLARGVGLVKCTVLQPSGTRTDLVLTSFTTP